MESGNNITEAEALDTIDLQIIQALQEDGRMPFAQIAERLNVSPSMIRARYSRLVNLGILRVAAITNPLRMGYRMMAMIGVKVEGRRLLAVADQVAALEEVIYLIITSGAYDLFLEVLCRDHAHLLQFLTEKLAAIDGIRATESFIHLKIVKEIYF